jgi:hypothetical protein
VFAPIHLKFEPSRSGLNQDSYQVMEVWLSTRHASNLSQQLKLFLSEDAQSWCRDVNHITVRDNLNGQIYRQNILEASVVPHFDNYPLNTRPVFMDDNARSHRALVVTDYLRDESIATLP